MNRWDRILAIVCLASAVSAAALAARALWVVSRLDVISEAGASDLTRALEIELSSPMDGDEVHAAQIQLSGFVDLPGSEQASATGVIFSKLGVDLVPVVRPRIEPATWWVQRIPSVSGNGFFEATAALGDDSGAGVGLEFEIRVVALPAGSVAPGDQLVEIPQPVAASESVLVKRRM